MTSGSAPCQQFISNCTNSDERGKYFDVNLIKYQILFSLFSPLSPQTSPHQLDIAEGGGTGGVINQEEGVSRPEPEVRIVEPLLLGGGREDRDGGEVQHPTLQSNYHLSSCLGFRLIQLPKSLPNYFIAFTSTIEQS